MAIITKDQIIEAIAAMDVMSITELITAMEEKFGVSSTYISPSSNTNIARETIEEKTEFDITLTAIGPNKIALIKAVRSVTNLGLKEAKDLVESAPVILREGVSKDEAESLKKVLEEVGAKIEIK